MSSFVLAGHQRGLAKKVAEAVAAGSDDGRLNGWNSCLLHSRLQNQSILEPLLVDEVFKEASKLGGAHVFGVSIDRKRAEVERQIKPYFRFRWIDAEVIAMTGQGKLEPLIAALASAIVEDQVWIECVKPKDTASPLILPGKIFRTKGEFRDLWKRCESYGDEGAIRAAGKLIHKFTTVYRKRIQSTANEKTPWLDDDDWVWKDDGEAHGVAPFPKNWKYSWAVPEKFHFDVMPKNPRVKTHFTDIHGNNHKLPKDSKYMNVTVHGEVRGYKGE